MTIRSNPVYQAVERVLDRAGIEFTVDQTHRHPRLCFDLNGKKINFVIPATPSDFRSPMNSVAQLKRMLRSAAERASVLHAEPAPLPSLPTEKVETMSDTMTADAIKVVEFRNQRIETVAVDGVPHVALKPIVEGMGLAWNGQFERLRRDQVLSEFHRVTRMPSHGGPQETITIPLKMLNGFLFGIDASRVKPGIKAGVIAYQRECYDALASYWLEGAAVNPRADDDVLRRIDGISRMLSHKVTGIEKLQTVMNERMAQAVAAAELAMEAASKAEHALQAASVDPRAKVVDQITITEALVALGVPQRGRRSPRARIHARAVKHWMLSGKQVGQDARTGTILFNAGDIKAFIAENCRDILADHKDHLDREAGQKVLNFPKARRLMRDFGKGSEAMK